ncbi:Beta-amyrin 11-oxidase, partial [Mucuna pruriens]
MMLLDCWWVIVLASLFGGYAFVFWFVRRVNEWYYVWRVGKLQHPLPPGDLGWPLFGNMPSFLNAFKSDPDSFLHHLVSRYGRRGMYRTHLFGKPSIIVCSAETCRKVLTDDEQLKLGYPASTMALSGKRSFHGISNVEHKRLRRLTTAPITGHEALSTYIGLIENVAVNLLEDLSIMDTPCEFLTEMRKFAFKVITTIFMGSHAHCVDLPLLDNLYTHLIQGMKSLPINLPGFAFYKALKARKKLMKLLQGLVDQKRRTNNIKTKTKKDMMDLLMEVKDEDGRKLEDEDIIDLILIFLLAGHESSAHGILWTIIYITENPHVFQRAKKEQEEILERRPSTQKGLNLKEIKQMEYLSKVIDEMLRRTSISFANFRQAKVDVNINGYTIPKGWKVLVWNRGVHMDPETYHNPKEYDPSRWENHTARAGSFLPFGLGSRFCPGSDLAKLEITIFLHHFLLNYRRVNEWYYVSRLGKLKYPVPPGDLGWPFLGNMLTFFKAFKSDPDSFLHNLISRHGKTGMYRAFLFGCPSIIVCSPDTCRKILGDDEQLKLGYPASAMALAGKRSLHGLTNVEHKRIKRLATAPITGHEALSTYIGFTETIAVNLLEELSTMNTPCEFLNEMRKFAFEVFTTIFMGTDRERVDLGLVENLYAVFNRGMKTMAINLPGFSFYKALKARKKLTKLLQSVVDQKRELNKTRTKTKKDMMDLFMEVKDEDGRQLEDEDIIDLILVFLMAGHESSAHGILWTIIYVTENPHVFQRAKKEQEEILESRPSTQKGLSLKEIKQMGYLSKVIDETLRKTTISFANFREAKVDIHMNGYTIPKGWKVLVWARQVHMDPDIFQNPKEYDPSRWENHTTRAGTFFPFGYGSRFCPGSELAKLEICVFLHHFLLNYR